MLGGADPGGLVGEGVHAANHAEARSLPCATEGVPDIAQISLGMFLIPVRSWC